MKRTLLSIALAGLAVLNISAQSGTNSPYSQFGLGLLADQSSGFNRGMNGLGLGLREHNQVNYLNPASYSVLDSLTFIFDVGASGQITNFNENGTKQNANNADLDYIVAGFRALKHVGISFGIIPFTTVGYNYGTSSYVGNQMTVVSSNTYAGSGGVHQAYIGAGWQPIKGISIGANISYLWGNYDRSLVNQYSDSYANTLTRYFSADIRSYKLDIGVQGELPISKKGTVTLGLTYSPGHKLNADPECMVISTNTQESVADTTTLSIKNGLSIPDMFGVGLAYKHNNQWKVGVDYTLQRWGSIEFPEFSAVNNTPQFTLKKTLKDRQKITVGGEYCKNEYGRSFFQRIKYRAGVSYATPYVTINGQDGPKEVSVSAGFGLPIVNAYNNRSFLNISGQWVRSTAPGYIKENIFRINIGLTFNERWFAKWKVD